MTERRSLKIREPVAQRFDQWQREAESQSDALARLLDEADVPEVRICAECGEEITAQSWTRKRDGDDAHFECVGIDPSEI